MQKSMNMFSVLFIITKVVTSNMVDALLLTYVLATMAGLDHAAVNVYHCQAVNMVTANQKHFKLTHKNLKSLRSILTMK